MSKEQNKKGKLSNLSNKKLEMMLNLLGPHMTAEKLNVTYQGLYKNMEKRGYRSKKIYMFPPDDL